MKRDEAIAEYMKDKRGWSDREQEHSIEAFGDGFDACLDLVLRELRSDETFKARHELSSPEEWADWLAQRIIGVAK